MHPKTKAAPSPSEYIPLETTDDDSTTYTKTRDPTTNESTTTITIREIATNNSTTTTYTTTKDPAVTNKSNKIDGPTTITIDTTSLEPLTSYGGEPPLPPPLSQAISNEENDSGVVSSLSGLLLTTSLSDLFAAAFYVVCFGYLSFLGVQITKFQRAFDPNIQVHSASLSLYNLSSSQITTEGEITFNVTKPPDCSAAFYDNIVVSLFHMEKPLSVANMQPFFQNEGNYTMVKAIFPPTIAPLEKPESGRIARDFNSSLSSEFSFDVNAKWRLWQNYWKSEDVMAGGRQMNVWCPDVKVKIMMETGVGMMAEPAKCKMKLYNDDY